MNFWQCIKKICCIRWIKIEFSQDYFFLLLIIINNNFNSCFHEYQTNMLLVTNILLCSYWMTEWHDRNLYILSQIYSIQVFSTLHNLSHIADQFVVDTNNLFLFFSAWEDVMRNGRIQYYSGDNWRQADMQVIVHQQCHGHSGHCLIGFT